MSPSGKTVGEATYDDSCNDWSLQVAEDYVKGTGPAFFDLLVSDWYQPTSYYPLQFIRERVCPPERQNIGAILYNLGESVYSEFAIIKATMGRCVMDDCYFEYKSTIQ